MKSISDIYTSRINKVIDYVNNNIHKSLPLEELAAVAHFSSFHFHRIFLAVTGETVNNFTNRIRNEKAARLLRFSKRPIAIIAIECGFSSTSTLSRLFKQYFGVSPSRYRKGSKIKNSKICKGLNPNSEYHCDMKTAELAPIFPVEIRRLPKRRIAYIRVSDAFRHGKVLNAQRQLISWAKAMKLFESETLFGMSKDDPEVTPLEKYQYEVCITIPEKFKIQPECAIETTVLPECKYAVTAVSGNLNLVAAAMNYLFDHWLINSAYECETQPGLEIFLDKDNICNWEHFDLEIMIPIKAVNSY